MGTPTTLPTYSVDLEPHLLNEKESMGTKLLKMNKFINSVREHFKMSSNDEKDNFLREISSNENANYFFLKTRLELANILKRAAPIISVWTCEDNTLLHRSLKFYWIFKDRENSPLLSDADFIPSLFSKMSHSVRMKIVNQIGKFAVKKDAERISQIFWKLEETYGIKLAKGLIASCDEHLIIKLITEKRIKLGHNQLLKIYKNYPNVILQYLSLLYEDLKKTEKHSCSRIDSFYTLKDACPSILRRIARDNPSEFLQLFEKFGAQISSELRFGLRLSRKLLLHGKDKIISNPCHYSSMLNKYETMKRLGEEEFKQFFTNQFPKSILNFQTAFELGEGYSRALYNWLNKFPQNKRYSVLEDSFKANYGNKSISDYPNLITTRLLRLMDADMRNKCVDFQVTKPNSGEYNRYIFHGGSGGSPIHMGGFWESFRTTDKSIPNIKQFLSIEPDLHRRSDLLVSLVNTCFINNDKQALKDVCQFVSSRFRNDAAEVRLEFLNTVASAFNLLKLDEEHWKPINELLHISLINNELSYRLQLLESLTEKSIHFRLLHELPLSSQIQHYIKIKLKGFNTKGESWCIATDTAVLERKALSLFADHLGSMITPTTPCPSDSAISSGIISLFESFAAYNKRHRKDATASPISASDHPWLLKRLQDVLDSYHEANKHRVIDALNHDPETKKVLFVQLQRKNPVPSVFIHFLRNEPEKLDQLLDQQLDFILASNKISEWKDALMKFRNGGAPTLLEKYVNKSLQILEDDEESLKERSNAIFILSLLLSSNHFVESIQQFYPSEDSSKLDAYTTSDEMGTLYGIRKMIILTLSNLTVPSQALHPLSIFCSGDYLKLSLGSLYSCVIKSTPSPQLKEFIKQLCGRKVSVKKHGIRLMSEISGKKENVEFLKELWEQEKHHSIRGVLFQRIYDLYVENNSQETWSLLTLSISSLHEKDEPFLLALGSAKGMPNDKISDYLSLGLEKVESIVGPSSENKWLKNMILKIIIPQNIQFIKESFIESIFEKYLFILDGDTGLESSAVSVAVNYLLYFPNSNSTKKMNMFAKYLDRVTGTAWDQADKNCIFKFTARELLGQFLSNLASKSFHKDLKGNWAEIKEIFSEIQKTLRKARDTTEFFIDDCLLSLYIICLEESFQENFDSLGKRMGCFVDTVVGLHQPHIISILSNAIKICMENCFQTRGHNSEERSKILLIIQGILNCSETVETKIVAAQLFFSQANWTKGEQDEKKFMDIFEYLKSLEDRTVRIFVNYRKRDDEGLMHGQAGYFV